MPKRIAAARQAAESALVDWPIACHLRHAPDESTLDEVVFHLVSDEGRHCGAIAVHVAGDAVTRVVPRFLR